MPSGASCWTGGVPTEATGIIQGLESFRAAPYSDNGDRPGGTWTIGFGTTRDREGRPVSAETPPVTTEQALVLLQRDMAGAARGVHRLVRVELAAGEASALISWAYNLGCRSLATSTMLARLNAGDRAAVPAEMRRWVRQGEVPVLGLLRRRWVEGAVFLGADVRRAIETAWSTIGGLQDWPDFAALAGLASTSSL